MIINSRNKYEYSHAQKNPAYWHIWEAKSKNYLLPKNIFNWDAIQAGLIWNVCLSNKNKHNYCVVDVGFWDVENGRNCLIWELKLSGSTLLVQYFVSTLSV